MPIIINDHELTDADVAAELPRHHDSPQPLHSATLALVLRRVLHDEAQRLGIPADDEEGMLASLLEREVSMPQVDEAACRRHYDQNPRRFCVGDAAEVEHILFAVTPRVPLDALRVRAQQVLAQVQAAPLRFAELAQTLSNCPSSANGGRLGLLRRGEAVLAFERAVFGSTSTGCLPELVETEHGLHIVRVIHRTPGQQLPFEQVKTSIARALQACNQDTAWRQYVRQLIARARVQGLDLDLATEVSHLMQ